MVAEPEPASGATFTGFDTFEGLSEKWLFSKRGYAVRFVAAGRSNGAICKGTTWIDYLQKAYPDGTVKAPQNIIHLDTSNCICTDLPALYLKESDIILSDEFGVANHECAAWEVFTPAYYVDYRAPGAVNNYSGLL